MTVPEYIDQDSIIWLAPDIPNPVNYARALLVLHRDFARELLAAYKTKDGWRYKYDKDETIIRQLRALGLCSVAGDGMTDRKRSPDEGWYLSNFALVVRNNLHRLINTGEADPLDEAAE